MWRRVALAAAVLAVVALPAGAQDADPFAKIFNDMKARWSAIDKADAQNADACAVGQAPRMSFQPATIYPDAAAAAADGMPPSASASLKSVRSGDHVLEAEQETIAFTGKPVHAPWMLTLRDGTTGASIAARTLPAICAPVAIATAPGGGFLMLSGAVVLLLDDSDLHVKALYRLTAKETPTGITALPDNRLLASTAMSPVLLYNLSNPMPQ
jgi:hypothetical protein